MKKTKNATHLHFSIKKSFLKLLSFAFVAALAAVISNAVPQNNDDFTISKAGLLSFAGSQGTSQQGKYTVAMSTSNVNSSLWTQVVVMNTQTGQSKLYQLFYDKHGGGWKVIELSSSKHNLGIPKANF